MEAKNKCSVDEQQILGEIAVLPVGAWVVVIMAVAVVLEII